MNDLWSLFPQECSKQIVDAIDKKKGKIFISSRTYNINQVEELINDFKGYLEQLRAIHK